MWGTTVDDAHKINEGTHAVLEVMLLTNGSTGTVVGAMKRMNMVVTTRWVGLEESVAGAYVATTGTVAGVEDVRSERMNEAGAYAVIRQDVIYGTWT